MQKYNPSKRKKGGSLSMLQQYCIALGIKQVLLLDLHCVPLARSEKKSISNIQYLVSIEYSKSSVPRALFLRES